jgi:enterochelin esterase family protein
VETRCATGLNDPKIGEKLKLLWDQIGKDDGLLKRNQEFEDALQKHNIKHHFQTTEGAHSWPVWRNYLAEFAPLLFK